MFEIENASSNQKIIMIGAFADVRGIPMYVYKKAFIKGSVCLDKRYAS